MPNNRCGTLLVADVVWLAHVHCPTGCMFHVCTPLGVPLFLTLLLYSLPFMAPLWTHTGTRRAAGDCRIHALFHRTATGTGKASARSCRRGSGRRNKPCRQQRIRTGGEVGCSAGRAGTVLGLNQNVWRARGYFQRDPHTVLGLNPTYTNAFQRPIIIPGRAQHLTIFTTFHAVSPH